MLGLARCAGVPKRDSGGRGPCSLDGEKRGLVRKGQGEASTCRAVGNALDRAFSNGTKCTIFLAIIWREN